MCNGIAMILLNDNGELKIFAKKGNGSHDMLLHEFIPIEKHNNVVKVEVIFPFQVRLDTPDKECIDTAMATGFVEATGLGNSIRLNPEILIEISKYLVDNREVFEVNKNLLQNAYLVGIDISKVDLSGADLSRANLSRANLSEADLSRANLSGADLSGAALSEYTISTLKNAYCIRYAIIDDGIKIKLGIGN